MASAFARTAPLSADKGARRTRWISRVFSSRLADDAAHSTRFSAPDLGDIGYDPAPKHAHSAWNPPKYWSL